MTQKDKKPSETDRIFIRNLINLTAEIQGKDPLIVSREWAKKSEEMMAKQKPPKLTVNKEMEEKAIRSVQEMQKSPVSWEQIDKQVDEAYSVHGQVNPNKRRGISQEKDNQENS